MNKSIFIASSLFLISFLGCKQYSVETDFIITNDSDYSIEIKAYNNATIYDEIPIEPGESIVRNGEFDGESIKLSFFNYDNKVGYERDSVVVIFDSLKYILQWCDGKSLTLCPQIAKNIANMAFDESLSESETKKKGIFPGKFYKGPYRIVFTNTDYSQADTLKDTSS